MRTATPHQSVAERSHQMMPIVRLRRSISQMDCNFACGPLCGNKCTQCCMNATNTPPPPPPPPLESVLPHYQVVQPGGVKKSAGGGDTRAILPDRS